MQHCIMGHAVWAQLAPGHPCGHWQSLHGSATVVLLITIATLPPAESASKTFRCILDVLSGNLGQGQDEAREAPRAQH